MTILDILANKGYINRYDIDELLRQSEEVGGDVLEALLAAGFDQQVLEKELAEYYGVPQVSVEIKDISPDIYKYIPEGFFPALPHGASADVC